MRNIRLTLAYDGTNYAGWQVQPNGPSIQAAVERALLEFTGVPVSLLASGRTDAGVHALGQVVNFQTPTLIPCSAFVVGLQMHLPRDIVVLAADEAPPAFHATYDAIRKRYRYLIWNARPGNPFLRQYAWLFPVPLDVEAMSEAVRLLVGRHDFAAFESRHPNKATSTRTVFEANVCRHSGWPLWSAARGGCTPPIAGQNVGDDFIGIDIVADGFLYNMMRAIAGTLVRVGTGKWTADDLRAILESRDRRKAGNTAPAGGLYLVHVEYAVDSPLSEARPT
jgi:tRNA pseudouridine38-40 synthase